LSTAILFNAKLYVYRPVDQLGQVSALRHCLAMDGMTQAQMLLIQDK